MLQRKVEERLVFQPSWLSKCTLTKVFFFLLNWMI
ncbi:hypothetical protein NC652_016910 [Populus alba x Populus x berolinensis]|nr:hypothetical protein NC652_016910 [Populus alba x Populus x berolinensis]